MNFKDFSSIPTLHGIYLVYFLVLSQCFWSNEAESLTVEQKTKKYGWTSRTNMICEDHPIRCDFYWSRGWYTCNKGGALWEHCPKSCGFCGDEPDCKDRRKTGCDFFKGKGFCTSKKPKIKAYMKHYCSKTCEMCKAQMKPNVDPDVCMDYEDMCSKWKKLGECQKSGDVRNFCPKSCGICGKSVPTKKPPILQPRICQDTNPIVCKQKYLCARKRHIAKKQCQKTCKMCEKSGSCYDLDSLCYWYKHQGHCKPNSQYYGFVTGHCAYSCGICKS